MKKIKIITIRTFPEYKVFVDVSEYLDYTELENLAIDVMIGKLHDMKLKNRHGTEVMPFRVSIEDKPNAD